MVCFTQKRPVLWKFKISIPSNFHFVIIICRCNFLSRPNQFTFSGVVCSVRGRHPHPPPPQFDWYCWCNNPQCLCATQKYYDWSQPHPKNYIHTFSEAYSSPNAFSQRLEMKIGRYLVDGRHMQGSKSGLLQMLCPRRTIL